MSRFEERGILQNSLCRVNCFKRFIKNQSLFQCEMGLKGLPRVAAERHVRYDDLLGHQYLPALTNAPANPDTTTKHHRSHRRWKFWRTSPIISSMKKRLAIFIIVSLLVTFYALSIFQPHRNFYPVVEIEAIDNAKPITLSFQFNKFPTLHNCEALIGNIARVVLKTCPQCRIKNIQCDDTLDEAQQALLTNVPLETASGRMTNGNIIFHAANTEVALAACQATAMQSARKNNPVECFAANTMHTKSAANMALSLETLALFLLLLLSLGLSPGSSSNTNICKPSPAHTKSNNRFAINLIPSSHHCEEAKPTWQSIEWLMCKMFLCR